MSHEAQFDFIEKIHIIYRISPSHVILLRVQEARYGYQDVGHRPPRCLFFSVVHVGLHVEFSSMKSSLSL